MYCYSKGSAEQCERDYGLTSKADNYSIVCPEGAPLPGPFKIRTWNAGQCCDYAMENQVDDVQFIRTLLNYLIENFKADANRIYIVGMSNGVMLAYRLLCEVLLRIKAMAAVSGTMMINSPCEPSWPVPILHIHLELDEIVPYKGGEGLAGYFFHSVDSTLQVMADIDQCAFLPNIGTENIEYTYRQWSCIGEITIESYDTKDGGHTWPGGQKPRSGAHEPSRVFDATQLIFEFFERTK